jgi:hypothetical protein
MALEVIGAGFGRTGTLSLKLALEQLGLGPCYHMLEVIENAGHVAAWQDAADGKTVDWDGLLAGYRSAVDWPTCAFWRPLADRYPQAKVILTVRDPDAWYASCTATIFKRLTQPAEPGRAAHRRMVRQLVLEQTFGGRVDDPEHAKAVFERNSAAVRAALPPERLLEFESTDGWEPLARFLGVPIPDRPYPRTNSTEEFLERARRREAAARIDPAR